MRLIVNRASTRVRWNDRVKTVRWTEALHHVYHERVSALSKRRHVKMKERVVDGSREIRFASAVHARSKQSNAVCTWRYVPHPQETRRRVGARVCVERVVRSARGEALSQGASKLHPEAPPFPRCAENQTPLTHSVTASLAL